MLLYYSAYFDFASRGHANTAVISPALDSSPNEKLIFAEIVCHLLMVKSFIFFLQDTCMSVTSFCCEYPLLLCSWEHCVPCCAQGQVTDLVLLVKIQ